MQIIYKVQYGITILSMCPSPELIKLFPCSTQLSMKFILLRNVKMTTIVVILTIQHLRDLKQNTSLLVSILVLMSSSSFMLSWVEHEKSLQPWGLSCTWLATSPSSPSRVVNFPGIVVRAVVNSNSGIMTLHNSLWKKSIAVTQGLPWLRICCSQYFSQIVKVGGKLNWL